MRNAEVLPLFARLSPAEQDRIFEGHTGRRVVLATNVAETSLTVPGIRYVIDTGTARVKRYLPQQGRAAAGRAVSQAAANQRAGRCGRVANGICIRLYDEKDFLGSAALHRPGNPALVAGRRDPADEVAAPGDVVALSLPRPARARAIADGYQLLNELGAVDDDNELTRWARSSRGCRSTRASAA
jgi:ATP-dependent helicase HrpA